MSLPHCPNCHSKDDWHFIFTDDGKLAGIICFICGSFISKNGEVYIHKKRKTELDVEPIKGWEHIKGEIK